MENHPECALLLVHLFIVYDKLRKGGGSMDDQLLEFALRISIRRALSGLFLTNIMRLVIQQLLIDTIRYYFIQTEYLTSIKCMLLYQ